MFKSGFVGVLGQTNVGKSTFINSILERKVVIVSEKIQTTRNRIRCVYRDEDSQIILVDTPGLHRPVDKLSKYLLKQAFGALAGLDLILYMVEPWVEIGEYDKLIFGQIKEIKIPAILLINKIDLAKGGEVEQTRQNYCDTGLFLDCIPISCKLGINLGMVIHITKQHLPEGPCYFPEDTFTDRPEHFLIAEFIREQIFRLTHQEIPYSTTVEVLGIREREDKDLIEVYAVIYVARNSQRGILIGKGGRMIREIGTKARVEIEKLLGTHVFLDLRVKVSKGWNEDELRIARLIEGDAFSADLQM